MDWTTAISTVLTREGGWSDRAEDRGGPTNRGITLALYSRWLNRPATVAELKAMPEGEARCIYMQVFVKDTNLDAIGSSVLKEALFDWMVNSGPTVAVKALQRQLGVEPDGVIGPATANAANLKDGLRMSQCLCWDRVSFIANWMRRDKTDADHDGVPDSLENAAGILLRIADLGKAIA
jgi:lysozyme family protein